MVNQRKYIIFWIGVLILSMFMAVACTKEPLYNPDCGVIASKTQDGDTWVTVYRWNTGECDTIVWHFDPESNVGDTICKLTEVNINDLNCKR